MSATATTSEAYLLSLARRAFLRMWSYPNLHNDKGKRPGGTGKELCDLLVIFGNDVVIFSDKHCSLDTEVEIGIAWPRWYKKAVLESSDQVRGAERWLLTQPSRVFEDTYCQQRLRVRLPREPKIHRVLTVRGAAAVARSEWAGRGSLVVTNRRLDACTAAPFRIGAFDGHNRMYHVFDENALDAILTTLDTAADFIRYLDGREAFFRKASSVTAFSEEDLLAKYMLSYDDTQHGLHFPESSGGDDVYIDGDHWNRWSRSAQRAARDAANSVSYAWDALVNEFLKHAYGGTQYRTTHSELADQEELMRWLACEDRFRRRMLAQSLLEMVRTIPPEHLRRRYYPPGNRSAV